MLGSLDWARLEAEFMDSRRNPTRRGIANAMWSSQVNTMREGSTGKYGVNRATFRAGVLCRRIAGSNKGT